MIAEHHGADGPLLWPDCVKTQFCRNHMLQVGWGDWPPGLVGGGLNIY